MVVFMCPAATIITIPQIQKQRPVRPQHPPNLSENLHSMTDVTLAARCTRRPTQAIHGRLQAVGTTPGPAVAAELARCVFLLVPIKFSARITIPSICRSGFPPNRFFTDIMALLPFPPLMPQTLFIPTPHLRLKAIIPETPVNKGDL